MMDGEADELEAHQLRDGLVLHDNIAMSRCETRLLIENSTAICAGTL